MLPLHARRNGSQTTNRHSECIGLKPLLLELGLDVGKLIVHEDNQAAQHVAKGKGRSRHIDLRYHWVREQVQRRIIQIRYSKFNTFITTRLGMGRVGVSERATL
ncbi:uncharacterized protein PITG_19945 [Phytophthora infestans T30-4]|uniref:Uncharacterized protein n=1 Tax=Phytophthora infestans (strain T30-4) TaxID=403677 RepID=D0P1U6_PHYIT|nr:uncharacterized protein PITG_19945 [Phytophthora infestans T30-4]EEY55079.1 hypothetical protein PITG_19945 [Phytophthora infestans T30-4]|eukprot:XP_002895738.1 hypothetical protein PITG_19945 [Phytophthora infestans T30-4]